MELTQYIDGIEVAISAHSTGNKFRIYDPKRIKYDSSVTLRTLLERTFGMNLHGRHHVASLRLTPLTNFVINWSFQADGQPIFNAGNALSTLTHNNNAVTKNWTWGMWHISSRNRMDGNELYRQQTTIANLIQIVRDNPLTHLEYILPEDHPNHIAKQHNEADRAESIKHYIEVFDAAVYQVIVDSETLNFELEV